nr:MULTISPECIES: hypothetical protein [unclassified Mycobacterium]
MTPPELPAPLAELTRLMADCANMGDFVGAAMHANELVTLCRAALGERDPNVLELKVSLASLQLQAGKIADAHADLELLIPDLVQVLGADHVSTLTARHLLAGRHQPSLWSLAEWLELYADEQRALGADHPSTLATRNKVAEKRWEIGDFVGARAEAEQVAAARGRALGADHADTLGTQLMLTVWRGRAGDIPAAVAELEPLLETLRETLGNGHFHTVIARHMLTLWAPERAGVTDGVAAWQALLQEEIRVLGEEHPVTAAAREQLSGLRARRGDAGDESSAEESLNWWLDWINVLIDAAADTQLRAAVPLDYSEASLRAVEGLLRDRYASPGRLLRQESLLAGLAAYLGETLMRVGGGAWEWTTDAHPDSGTALPRDPQLLRRVARHRWRLMPDDEPDAVGLPIVAADPGTGLPRLSPVHLLLDAAGSGDGEVLAGVYQHWRRVVAERAAARPGWVPVKQHTLVDGVSPSTPAAALDEWLDQQREGFARWSALHGGDWDFSGDTVDRLAALVSRVTPTVGALNDPANAEFVHGATYYLGELLRRGYPSRWVYRDFRDEGDPEICNFALQLDDHSGFTSPYYLLRLMLRRGDPNYLRIRYIDWVG